MINFDSSTFNRHASQALQTLRDRAGRDDVRMKEQKNQAQELYTYISTWGLMRLKGEEQALKAKNSKQKSDSVNGKQEVVATFFEELQKISKIENIEGEKGLDTLISLSLKPNDYLGLTGLAIELANEFGFWANVIYYNIQGAQ